MSMHKFKIMNPSRNQKNKNPLCTFMKECLLKKKLQVSVSAESQPVNVELHSDVELQNQGNAHFDSEISIHERDVELLIEMCIVTLILKGQT